MRLTLGQPHFYFIIQVQIAIFFVTGANDFLSSLLRKVIEIALNKDNWCSFITTT